MAEPTPPGPRVLAGVAALAVLYLFAVLVLNLLDYPWTVGYASLVTPPFLLFLGLLAAKPSALQPFTARFTRLDLRDGGHVGAAVLLAASLWYVFGFGMAGGVHAIESAVRGVEEPLGEISGDAIFANLAVNLVVLTVPPLVYVSFVHGHGPRGALASMGLRAEDFARGILPGVLLAFGFLAGLVVLGAILSGLKVQVPENERALDLARQITVLGALTIATVAAISEEVLFRGFLQPRIGIVLQAILFALLHLSYVHVLQVVFTLVLGLILGLVRHRTGSLWAPMIAHFTFDLVQLVLARYLPEMQ